MNIVMCIIFMITDLSMILLYKVAYGKNDKYAEGMLWGVHIPSSAVEREDVKSICIKGKKKWKIFQSINLFAGILICFLCLWELEFFIVIWLIWLIVYIAGQVYLMIVPHREMYRLKLENHWVDERTGRTVYIDTAVSAAANKLAISWKWHLPILLFILVTGLFPPEIRGFLKSGNGFLTLFGLSLVMSLFFLGFHIWSTGRQNVVCSQNTEINLAVNQMIKRAWSVSLVAADAVNGAAWGILAFQIFRHQWLSGMDYLVYTMIQVVAGIVVVIPILQVYRKKQSILEKDGEPLYVDDDEYWKDGWYNNPDDKRLMVQDRMNSMNYTMNMGRPAGRVLYGAGYLILAGVLLWTIVIMLQFRFAKVTFKVEDTHARIEAAGYKCTFDLSEIEEAELLRKLPDEGFVKTNGGGTDEYSIGHFTGKESGKCMLFLLKDYSPILKITLPDTVIFANSKEPQEVKEWYRIVKADKARQ